MKTVAYLRVSTDKQELEKSKAEIRELCDRKGLGMPEWVQEVASSRVHWQTRKIGQVVESLSSGDQIVVSEMSRLGRSMMEIMTILNTCIDKKIEVHAVKGEWSLDNSIQSKVMAMAFSIAAEIERDLISKRTTEALRERKRQGVTLGRPQGKSKLDGSVDEIKRMFSFGATQKAVSKVVGCTPETLRRWMKQNNIDPEQLQGERVSHTKSI